MTAASISRSPWPARTVPTSPAATAKCQGGELGLDGPGPTRFQDLLAPVVAVEDGAAGVELQHAHRQGLGQAAEEQLPRAQLLLGPHLVGDVDHLVDDVAMFGVPEAVVVGDLEPAPGAVDGPVPYPGSLVGSGLGEHPHPGGHRAVVVLRVDELQGALSDDVLRAPTEHGAEGTVHLEDARELVLAHDADTRTERRVVTARVGDLARTWHLDKAQVDAVLLAGVIDADDRRATRVQGRPGGQHGPSCPAHLGPQFHDPIAVPRHDEVDPRGVAGDGPLST